MSDWEVVQAPAASSDWEVVQPAAPSAPPPREEPANPVASLARRMLNIDPRSRFSFSNIGKDDGVNPTVSERLGNAGAAVNSGIDSAFFGAPTALAHTFGDPTGISQGIENYRANNPTLAPITDAIGSAAPGGGVEGAARLAEEALPQAANRVAKVARTALTSAAAGGTSTGLHALSSGESLPEAGKAAAKGAGAGLVLGAGLGAGASVAGKLGEAVLNSRGGKARTLIDTKGQGAEASLFSPGMGGVFDRELSGVTRDSAGEGQAAMIGGRGLLDQHEQAWSDETGNPVSDYRRSPADYVSEIKANAKEAVGPRPRKNIDAAIPGAESKLAEIESAHNTRKAPFVAQKQTLDESLKAGPRYDVSELETQIRDSLNDPATSDRSVSKLQRALSILDAHRDRGTATPEELSQLKEFESQRAKATNPGAVSGFDKLIAPLKAKAGSGKILMTDPKLNGLRRYLYGNTSVGTSDVRPGSEAPILGAAGSTKGLVDEGPYGDVNAGFSDVYKKRQADREWLGLNKRVPKDRGADVQRIARREAGAKFVNESAAHEAASAHAKDETDAYARDFEEGKNRARKPRTQLGLSEDIPSRRAVDEGALKLRLLDRGKDTNTAGGKTDFSEYLADNPDAQKHLDLPELARARNRLSFGISPHGGDLLSVARLGTIHGKLRLAALNASPIAGRVLYPGAKEAALAEPDMQKLLPLLMAARAANGDKR